MYAVYGLKETSDEIEEFLGYTPATFFDNFSDPTIWSIGVIPGPDGIERVGRICGRAFFVSVFNLKPVIDRVKQFMGDEAVATMTDPGLT